MLAPAVSWASEPLVQREPAAVAPPSPPEFPNQAAKSRVAVAVLDPPEESRELLLAASEMPGSPDARESELGAQECWSLHLAQPVASVAHASQVRRSEDATAEILAALALRELMVVYLTLPRCVLFPRSSAARERQLLTAQRECV